MCASTSGPPFSFFLQNFLTNRLTTFKLFSAMITKKKKKKLIIVHDLGGSPESDWLPWLKREMEGKGWDVVAPLLPNSKEPLVFDWLLTLGKAVGKVDEDTYIVGHSLGAITTLKLLDNLSGNESIGGVVLVAGFDNPVERKEMENFFYSPLNWEKVKRTCKKFVIIHSEDDPVVPADNGVRMKNKLDAERILVDGYRHFSAEEGIHTLPLVLQELLEISDSSK